MYINIHMHIKMRVNMSSTQYPPKNNRREGGGVLLLHTLLVGGSELRLLWARKETKLNSTYFFLTPFG